MGFDLGNFLSGAAKAAGDAVQTVEKIPGASDAIKSVAGKVGVDQSVVDAISNAGTKIANGSPVISAAGNLGKDVPGFAHGFAVGVGTMQTPVDKAQHLAVLRGSLEPGAQQGFDTAVALHVGGIRRPPPPLPPKARAAYQITHGMIGAPVAQKDMLMESIAVDAEARPGAVQAIKEVASERETLWEKLMGAAGFHGPSDRTNRDFRAAKFGDEDDDAPDGGDGDDADGGGGDDGGGDDGGGGDSGGGGGGGGGDDSPQKKHHHHHHHGAHHPPARRPGVPGGARHAQHGRHHGEVAGDPPMPWASGMQAMIVPPGMPASSPASTHGWDVADALNPHAPFLHVDPHRMHKSPWEHDLHPHQHPPLQPPFQPPFPPQGGPPPFPPPGGPPPFPQGQPFPHHHHHDPGLPLFPGVTLGPHGVQGPHSVGQAVGDVLDPLHLGRVFSHIFGEGDGPVVEQDPAAMGWEWTRGASPQNWDHHDHGFRHDYGMPGGRPNFGPPMGVPAAPLTRPAPPMVTPPAPFGAEHRAFERRVAHHLGQTNQHRTRGPEEIADFGKHHHPKKKSQMGVELPPSAQAFGEMGFHMGCFGGEMQTDPQGHVALYGAQHDPTDWDLRADPLLEINASVAIYEKVGEKLDEAEDAQAARVANEGIMP